MYPETRLEKTKRVIKWLDGDTAGPTKMEVEITDLCNLRCTFCWQRSAPRAQDIDPTRELSDERWFEIVDESARLGVLEWRICGGGEPLCRKRATLGIIDRLKGHGMAAQLTTNGVLFREDELKRLVENGLDILEFSLEAPSTEDNDPLRGKGVFESVQNAIRTVNRYRDLFKTKLPRVQISAVLVRENYRTMVDMMRWAGREKIDKISYNPLTVMGAATPEGLAVQNMKLVDSDRIDMQSIILEAKAVADGAGVETNVEQFQDLALVASTNTMNEVIVRNVETRQAAVPDDDPLIDLPDKYNLPCYGPWYCIAIRPYGKAGACVLFDETGVDLHAMSLEEVWYSD
ncbi:radical SAM protein, partial [bacterium]|nr:radical SAM protein [candidate division CSSED10-310 bacterium]